MSVNGSPLTKEQQIQARALAEVINEREKRSREREEKLRYERPVRSEPARIEIGPPHNLNIQTDAIGEAIADALKGLGPIQTTNNIDVSAIATAIKEVIENVSTKQTDIKVDMGEIGQSISKMADVISRFEKSMSEHNRLIEKLVSALSKPAEIVVNLPEQKPRTKTIHRDNEGNIKSVTES